MLAGLGVNTYFTGEDASDIDVNAILVNDASFLAVGADHVDGSNGTALGIAQLGDTGFDSLGGLTILESWAPNVESLAVRSRTAIGQAASTKLVRESLEAQQAAVSGVSLDEEAVNLLNFQRQYEAAAKYISVIDQLMQTLMSVI